MVVQVDAEQLAVHRPHRTRERGRVR
jgi:hypothetical protein